MSGFEPQMINTVEALLAEREAGNVVVTKGFRAYGHPNGWEIPGGGVEGVSDQVLLDASEYGDAPGQHALYTYDQSLRPSKASVQALQDEINEIVDLLNPVE